MNNIETLNKIVRDCLFKEEYFRRLDTTDSRIVRAIYADMRYLAETVARVRSELMGD